MQSLEGNWFKAVLDSMSDMVLVKGTKSQLLWANKAFRTYYGMSEAELVDIIDAKHSDPDDTLQYVIDDQIVFETRKHLDVPQEAVTDSKGHVRLFHTVKSPIFHAENEDVSSIVGVSRLIDNADIQKREVEHQEAKAFVAPLHSVTRSFPNPMLMVDIKNRIINSSPLWNSTFGSIETSANTFFDDVYTQLDCLGDKIRECLAQRKDQSVTISLDEGRSSPQVFSIRVSPWGFSDGGLGGAIVIATDVTLVHERSAALKRANDELIQYSYRASHDLRGPITTAKRLAQAVSEDIDDGELEEACENAKKIVAQMQRLEGNVSSILDLARADLKHEGIEKVNLADVLDGICDGLESDISCFGIKIIRNLAVQHVYIQRPRIRQILDNLIANAVKYHAKCPDGRYVSITTKMVDSTLKICVRDNGQGIAEEFHDRIFDPFCRFSSESAGSGLGLAIVKKHIDTLEGDISLESSTDGTMFTVLIPVNPEKK